MNEGMIATSALVVMFVPLFGAIIMYLISKTTQRPVVFIQSLGFLLSFAAAVFLFIQFTQFGDQHFSIEWFRAGDYVFNAGILINAPCVLMCLIVSFIGLLVSVYSERYMKGEGGEYRYFGILGFFAFSMFGIVLADSLLLIFVFWELVGFSSYLLINHYFRREDASKASMKAFLVNRIGDAGFVIGAGILWMLFHTLDITELESKIASLELAGRTVAIGVHNVPFAVLTLAGIGLFLGAVGKSAQFPLQVWLPDAMAGPTPVSALIHAATMVAAGVFLLSRIFPVLNLDTLQVIAFTGGITAFMGAIAAMTQHDIKRVLAYSTISQLGYMIMGMGVGAYDAAMFHLLTHAFFKAGLFLAAGAVIFALHRFEKEKNLSFDVQDMRNMGGLKKTMPYTFGTYVVLSMALVGLPLFSGFLSKDAIIAGAFAWAGTTISLKHLVPFLGLVTVALTAFYMVRQLILVFFGEFRFSAKGLPVPPPARMKYVLALLAVLSIGFVWSLNPLDASRSWAMAMLRSPELLSPDIAPGYQAQLVADVARYHIMISILSVGMIIAGILLAIRKFNDSYHQTYRFRTIPAGKMGRLSFRNWWLDDIYDRLVVKPVRYLAGITEKADRLILDRAIHGVSIGVVIFAHVTAWFDRTFVDGFIRLIAGGSRSTGSVMARLSSGSVQYFVLFILFASILLIWIVI